MERKIPVRGLLAIETQIVLERMSKMLPGEVVTYAELNKLSSCNVQERRNVISTSANKLLAEQGKVFVAEHGKGVRLLTNEEIPSLGAKEIGRIAKISKRVAKKMSSVDYDKLSEQGKIHHNTHMTILVLMQRASTKKSLETVEGAVVKRTSPLPLGETLKLFGA